MRLHPVTGFILERHVPPGGTTLCSTYLPAGTVVGVNAWAIHRDKSIYGDDANAFRPERWLQESYSLHKESENKISYSHNDDDREETTVSEEKKNHESTEGRTASEYVAEMRRNFFMFGHGARVCLGRHIATMQMVKLVFELYRRFEIGLPDPEKKWKVSGGWITKQTEMDLVFVEREGWATSNN